MSMPSATVWRAALWTLAVALCSMVFVTQWRDGPRVESDILALLPDDEQSPLVAAADQHFANSVGQRNLFLIGHRDPEIATQAADRLHDTLLTLDYADVRHRIAADTMDQLIDTLLPHRHGLLSEADRKRLQEQLPNEIAANAARRLYTLPVPPPVTDFDHDPFGLLAGFVHGLNTGTANARLLNDQLVIDADGLRYVVIAATNPDGAFSINAQEQRVAAIHRTIDALQAQWPDLDVLRSGLLFHAVANSIQARSEISTVGFGSALGVILMLVIVFRSLRPLLLSLLTIGTGCFVAWTVASAIFGQLHVIALVFGCSLIGTTIDYSLHFFADRWQATEQPWTPKITLNHVLPGIVLGVLTSVLGYLGLIIAPFPGLQQLAVFAAIGLIAAFFCVWCWYPLLSRGLNMRKRPTLLAGLERAANVWASRVRLWPACALLIALAVPGLWQLSAADDIRQLHASPPSLIAQEQRVSQLLGSAGANQLFVVTGDNPGAVLDNERQLIEKLHEAIDHGAISSFQALSSNLPSATQQAADRQLVQTKLLASGGALEQLAQQLGLTPKWVHTQRAAFADTAALVTMDQWLQTPAGEAQQHLWLGPVNGAFASLVLLGGVSEIDALANIAETDPNVWWVDRVGNISTMMGSYRAIAGWLIVAAYLSIGLLLLFRYRLRDTIDILLPPITASICVLGLLGWTEQALNLFHVFAMLLVLGIGIDYTIFFREADKARATTLLAVVLSAMTTVLSFGLLALSQTPAISGFGLVLLIGIPITMLLAPAVGARSTQRPAESLR